MGTRVVVVPVDPDWRPVEGDFFDGVVAALQFAAVPARVIEHDGRHVATARADDAAPPMDCPVCDGEVWPGCWCDVCAACSECCSCAGRGVSVR
jgi:hypothetical protein